MPDTNQLLVLNAALAELGNEPLTDLNDDSIQNSGAAYKLMRSIELSRDVVLARHGWLCALTYLVLTSEAAEPGNWKYPTLYRLPGDCLRVWEIEGICDGAANFDGYGGYAGFSGWGQGWAPKWQTATIDSDQGALQVIRAGDRQPAVQPGQAPGPYVPFTLNVAYVRRASFGALPPHLVDAIGAELAARCCYAINGDQGKMEKLKTSAEQKILAAISVEGTQEGGQDPWAGSIPQAIRNRSR